MQTPRTSEFPSFSLFIKKNDKNLSSQASKWAQKSYVVEMNARALSRDTLVAEAYKYATGEDIAALHPTEQAPDRRKLAQLPRVDRPACVLRTNHSPVSALRVSSLFFSIN